MTHTLQLTFLGLCLFHLGNPVGEPAQDLVDSATVYLINALDVDLGTPRESCSGDAELYRHEPMLTIDPEEWAVVGESPETALEPVIDLSETRVTILNDMPTQWVEAPRSDLQFGSVPDGTEGAGPPHELQWIAPLERILGEESLETPSRVLQPTRRQPLFHDGGRAPGRTSRELQHRARKRWPPPVGVRLRPWPLSRVAPGHDRYRDAHFFPGAQRPSPPGEGRRPATDPGFAAPLRPGLDREPLCGYRSTVRDLLDPLPLVLRGPEGQAVEELLPGSV